MTLGLVLDPTAARSDDIADNGRSVGDLRGKVIGFRVDELWRSWDWVSEIWAAELKKQGAIVKFWRPRGRTGEIGEQVLRELDTFTSQIDAAVIGLANCGSCTSWTIHDALWAARKGIPTVAIATQHFVELAGNLARRGGRSGLRVQALPYPLDILQEANVHDIAREHYRPFLRTLGLRDRLVSQSAA